MRRLVVDANVVVSAALRDGTTRRLLTHPEFELFAPQVLWEELERHRSEIVERSGVDAAAIDLFLQVAHRHIRDVPTELVKRFMGEAMKRLGPDTLDAPYVAAALAIGGTLWSHDKRLARKAGLAVVTTKDLLV